MLSKSMSLSHILLAIVVVVVWGLNWVLILSSSAEKHGPLGP